MTQRLALILWAAGFLGNGVLFSVLMLRKHWQRFPVFTLLAGYEVVRSIVLFLISHAGLHAAYVSVYWTSEFLDTALQVALLVELGRTISHAEPAIQHSGLRQPLSLSLSLYRLGGAVLLAALCAMAIPTVHGTKETLDMRASLFTSLLTCELYLLILRRVNRLQLKQCRQAMAISKGIFAWSTCVLASDLIHQINGWQNQAVYFDEFRSIVVVMMLIYWSAFFWRTSPELQRNTWPVQGASLTTHAYAGKVGS